MEGYIHSFESFGTKDGPGIRFIVFMQGCPLRCLYCHNPDTWEKANAQYRLTPEEVFAEIDKVRAFVRGGVTVSGGEPMLQPEFVRELFEMCRAEGMHTAVDTSGIVLNDKVKAVLEVTDLVLLDIKHINPGKYRILTSQPLEPTLRFMDYLAEIKKPVWLRYVLVPGYTDGDEDLAAWARYASGFANVERVDILPFHQMAANKWERLNLNNKLRDTPAASVDDVKRAEEIFRANGLNI